MAENRDRTLGNNHKLYLGGSRRGKTTGISQDKDVINADILFCYDPYGDHYDNATQYRDFSELVSVAQDCFANGKRCRVAYWPTKNTQAELDKLSELVWIYCDGRLPITYIVEEASVAIGKSGHFTGATMECFSAGGAFNLQMILSAQSATTIPKTITTNCDQRFLFGQNEPEHAKSSGKMIGRDGDEFLHLQKGEYYHFIAGQPISEKKRTRKPTKKA